ncbi:MAG TPA: FAD-dependent oxidoreductase [Solirubrobacteraceae bacterium]|nr:FAD-dependent oxidoreductase [Solirubrobacteraceae bacterium]
MLCVVHDAPGVRELLVADLRERFGRQYEVEGYPDAHTALEALRRHASTARAVSAVFGADTEACGGDAFRATVRELHPHARRVVLVGRGEWSKAHPAVAALRSGQAESYIFVPWVLRERWLYLPVSELLADWEASQRPDVEVVQVIGREWEPRTHALRELLSRIGLPLGFYPSESPEGRDLLERAGVNGADAPVLAFRTGAVIVDPSLAHVANQLGFATEPDEKPCDLAIIGGGPAGLAAAVYGASEGLATVLIEQEMVGGQAGTSSRIRNYLGFPTGVSGRDLTSRALEQAWFFGARVVLSRSATGIASAGAGYRIELAGAPPVAARTVIVATGVTWRTLGVPALEALRGAGVFYGAAASDAAAVKDAQAFIVGAGNSAGQAAVHLARTAASVTLVVRGERLGVSMSDYLVRELEKTPNVTIRLHTEVIDGGGGAHLESLTLRDNMQEITEEVPADALYVMIGAHPHTDWLAGAVSRDELGYILTGEDVIDQEGHTWPLSRPPMLQESSLPGVFAAGDVRHGTVKRVASAVGSGAIAVQLAHIRLAEMARSACHEPSR